MSIDNERFGWSAKVFKVASWKLAKQGESLGCQMTFTETASTVFDWDSGEETAVDPAPPSVLPNPLNVLPPENLTITEEIYDTRGSAGVKVRAIVNWDAPNDASIIAYQAEGQQTQDKDGNVVTEDYSAASVTSDTQLVIQDIEPGVFNFRVKSINFIGVSSDYTTKTGQEITGLLAPPTEPQNLTVSAIGGIALLRWDVSPDLDVVVGGTYVFRHDADVSSPGWTTAVSIGAAIPGSETVATLPLKSGTYLVKAVDSSGIESTSPATVETKQATVQPFVLASSITEHATFPGSTTNVAAIGGGLKLVGSGLVDSIPDVSSVADWDSLGGAVASGTYVFSAAFDWGSVLSKRYTSTIGVSISNVNDLIDSRATNIDDWTAFDGDVTSACDARVYSSETDDDPAGSPSWAEWQLLESAELTARAVRFKAILTTSDPAFNIEVSVLSVAAETAA